MGVGRDSLLCQLCTGVFYDRGNPYKDSESYRKAVEVNNVRCIIDL